MAEKNTERPSPPTLPRITIPGTEKEVSVKAAESRILVLQQEAQELRDDDSSAAKARRVAIASQMRAIRKALDATEAEVDVTIAPDATHQFPFIIGGREFWPGTHRVRSGVAQVLNHMMYQHRVVESRRVVNAGNAVGDSYGKELPAL